MFNPFKKKAKTIGERIAEERKKKGYTQAKLAEMVGVSDKAVSKWEAGGGDPSVEMLFPLSEALGVSIDYLVAGKEKEAPKKEKDGDLSPAEKCAKYDDPKLAEGLSLNVQDGKGRNLSYYMSKYGSGKVFVYLLDKLVEVRGGWPFSRTDILRFILIANRLDLLDKLHIYTFNGSISFSKKEDLFLLGPTDRESGIQSGSRDHSGTGYPVLLESYFDTVVSDARLNKETRDFAFGLTLKSRPCHHYPGLIHAAYMKKDWKTLDFLMEEAKKSNAGMEYIKKNYGYVPGGRPPKIEGAIVIEKKTLEEALKRRDFEHLEKFHDLNRDAKSRLHEKAPLIEEYDMKMAKLEESGDLSASDILIEKSIKDAKNPVLDLSVLMAEADIATIEKAFGKYPIYKDELRYNRLKPLGDAIEKEDWRAILRYYVDNEYGYIKPPVDDSIPYWLRQMNIKEAQRDYESLLASVAYPIGGWAKDPNETFLENYFRANNPTMQDFRRSRRRSDTLNLYKGAGSCKKVAEWAEEDKALILEMLRHKKKMDASAEGLTKEYFEEELAKGNEEMVVIKLCKLLETVLKEKYLYEGDLSEMLDEYCKSQRVDSATAERLHTLRMQRNALVHAEATGRTLGLDELKKCIEYVTAMK